MDIVNRIKTFMNTYGIGSTQFADACRIPRPTLSQILSGRNKKISDEVISKIHDAYPQLSVLWLLFGEGDMLVTANIALPEAQTGGQKPSQAASRNGFGQSSGGSSEKLREEEPSLFGGDELIFDDEAPLHEVEASASVFASETSDSGVPTVQIPADGSKSIVNIMVFYSDNSYQSFVPR